MRTWAVGGGDVVQAAHIDDTDIILARSRHENPAANVGAAPLHSWWRAASWELRSALSGLWMRPPDMVFPGAGGLSRARAPPAMPLLSMAAAVLPAPPPPFAKRSFPGDRLHVSPWGPTLRPPLDICRVSLRR